jgi:hypothetical protein
MKTEKSRAILNLLTTYMKLYDVVTQVVYFYLIIDQDSNRKNNRRKIGKKIIKGL